MESKLYLNMILGDFEPPETVKRSLDSVKDYVDGMYLTITYKNSPPSHKHPLVKLLKRYKANISYFKWIDRFDKARQFALDQVPKGDNIYVYWQDADDVLHGAEMLRPVFSDMVALNQSAVYFTYWYMVELDEKGQVREVLISHKRERIIRNDSTWEWVGRLHETLIEQKRENMSRVFREECIVVHLTDPKRTDVAVDRNIAILEEAARQEQHKDPRTLAYLGKAYFDKGKSFMDKTRDDYFGKALVLFHEYLEGRGAPGSDTYIAPSGWREERATVWSHIGEIAILQGHPEIGAKAFQSAIDEGYEFPNYYVDLAMCYSMLKDFKRAKHWLNQASTVSIPNTTIILFPRDLKLRSLLVSLEINMHEQKLDEALEDVEKILEITPDDEGAKKNKSTIEQLIVFNRACQSVVFLGKYLEKNDAKDQLAHLVQAIPPEMYREKFAAEMRHRFMPAKIWGENEVAIMCGAGFEKWSPKSLETGLGGSEEAVVHLARELTQKGWKVTVYGHPMDDAGVYEGVEYRPYFDFNIRDSFNVLVLWRAVGFIDFKPKAKFTLLWMHDIPNNPDFTKERVEAIDKIAVLTEFHKSLFRMNENGTFVKIPDHKFFLTSNGIDTSLFSHPDIDIKKWKGDPKRLIYMSSPDRGLVYLLKNWSRVRSEVPEAELHIFYGFTIFDALHAGNPAQMKWKETVLSLMKQPGIIYHNRVGHRELHYEIAKSGIWAYPTDFEEISCISAMKAQAYGAIPVVTDYAALTETVKNGIKVDVNIKTEAGQKEYFDALINILKDETKQTDIRSHMMEWARDYFKWSDVAANWDELFRVHLQNPEKKLELKEVL